MADDYASQALNFNKKARDVRPTLSAMGFEKGATHILEVQSEQIGVLEKQITEALQLIDKLVTVIGTYDKALGGVQKEVDKFKHKYRDVDEETDRHG